MKKRLKYFLAIIIFIISIVKLRSELTAINFRDVFHAIQKQSVFSVVSLAAAGLSGILILSLYDLVLVRSQKMPALNLKTLKISWIANSLNALIGFGGVVGLTVRYNYYRQYISERDKSQLKKNISLLMMSMITGIGVLSILVISGVFAPAHLLVERPYLKVILGLLACLLPVFLVVTVLKPPLPQDRWLSVKYTLVSAADYALAGFVMFLALHFVGVTINFWQMESIFIVATIAGLISMVPGGLGAFDVIFLLGMTNEFGLTDSAVLLAVVFYRLVYNILPFILGVILSISEFQAILTDKLADQKLVLFSREFGSIVVSLTRKSMSYLARFGLMIIFLLVAFFHSQDAVLAMYFNVTSPEHRLNMVICSLYFVFSLLIVTNILGIYYGSAESYRNLWLKLLIIFFSQLAISVQDRSFVGLFLTIMLMGLLFFSKNLMRVSVTVRRWQELLLWAVVLILLFVQIYGLAAAVGGLVPGAERLIVLVMLGTTLVWCLYAVGSRLYLRRTLHFSEVCRQDGMSLDKADYLALVKEYGGDSLAHLGLLSGNQVLVDLTLQNAVIFQETPYFVMILGDPQGDEGEVFSFIQKINDKALEAGKYVIFYQVSPRHVNVYIELDCALFNLGEEGEIDLSEFKITGNKGKLFRQLLNKQERAELTFAIEEPTDALINELKPVSDSWLGNRHEMTFSIGNFDETYLRAANVATVRDKRGKLQGFATLMPSYTKESMSVDLIRWQEPEAVPMMDLLYLQMLLWSQEQGYRTFNIGMAPLSSSYEKTNGLLNAMTSSIYQHSSSMYSFKGLRNYKQKFRPKWQPKYLIYPKRISVLTALYQSYRVIHPK